MDCAAAAERTTEKSEADSAALACYGTAHGHLLDLLLRHDWLLKRHMARSGPRKPDDILGFAAISQQEVERQLEHSTSSAQAVAAVLAIDATLQELERQIDEKVKRSRALGMRLPLVELARRFALSAREIDLLFVGVAVEIDRRYERVYGFLHDDMSRKLPSPALALDLYCENRVDQLEMRELLSSQSALRHYRLIEVADDGAALPWLSRPLWAGAALLATTLLFGATFPLVVRLVVDRLDAVGARIGAAYAANTLGAIAGAVGVGFVLLPALGMRGAFVALVLVNLVVGAGLALAAAPRGAGAVAGALAAMAAALTLALVPPSLFEQSFVRRFGPLLFYREEVTDTVMVTQDARGDRMIRFSDGRGTAGTMTVRDDKMYAHIPLLLHPAPRRVLSICFGVGNSLAAATTHPVERIDAVELSPGVVETPALLSKKLGEDWCLLGSSRKIQTVT